MKRLLLIILCFSFLFSLGKRQNRKEYTINECTDFPLSIANVKSWHIYDGKWNSNDVAFPKFKAYEIKGFEQYLILVVKKNAYSHANDLFVFNKNKFKNRTPLKINSIESIMFPYILYLSDVRTYNSNGFLSAKDIESTINSLLSSDSELESLGALRIDYYSYILDSDESDVNMVQYIISKSRIGEGYQANLITSYTPTKIKNKNPSIAELEKSLDSLYYETDSSSFFIFLTNLDMNYILTDTSNANPESEIGRPAIPIEADDESEIDTLDFMDTDIEGFDSWAAPPSKKKNSGRKFVIYDKDPEPKKKLSPRYPDICRSAGVEGKVTLEFYIDETGKVDQSSVTILNSVPCLDQVCIDAIRKSKWKPARQGKDKVGVYITKTFNFTLEQSKSN